MKGIPVAQAYRTDISPETDRSQDGVSEILQLLDRAEVLANEQGLAELSFLIGLAAIAASEIAEEPATDLDL